MSKNIFITATGTDIGKTYVSALIVKGMREAGFDCGYFKPVLSGGGKYIESELELPETNARACVKLINSDCNYVVETAKIPCEADECVAYWWEEAVSPHLAAKRAGQEINVEKIKHKFNELNKKYDYLLIEGAGGITCPLRLENGEKYLLKDLIKELAAPIVIVADGGLGTINSTLLTVEYARNNNIPILGIILNNFEPDNIMHQDNLKQVEYLTGEKVIATIEKGQKEIKFPEELWTGKKKI